MTDMMGQTIVAAASFGGLVVVTIATLKGWRDWIGLQRQTLDGTRTPSSSGNSPAGRIELADLKERVRKLEAIAAGVDL